MSTMFVTFDNEGVIKEIRPLLPTDNETKYIEVDFEDVRPILELKESFQSYIIEWNNNTKQFHFKKKVNFNKNQLTVNDLIYKVPQKKDLPVYDITIQQDFLNNYWKIVVDTQFKNKILDDKTITNFRMFFSVTQENNPNILYRTLDIDFGQLLRQYYFIVDFDKNFEFERLPVSLYTPKRFESYLYERINL